MSLNRIIPLVVLGLAVFAVGCGDGNSDTQAKTDKKDGKKEKKKDPRLCDVRGINVRVGKSGTCIREGKTFTVANRRSTLQLREIAVRVGKVRATGSLPGAIRTIDPEKGRTFVLVDLTVRNKLKRPAKFNANLKQVRLRVAGAGFATAQRAEGAVGNSFFNQNRTIKPGKTQKGVAVFQVKAGAAKALRRRGADPAVLIWNFTDQAGKEPPNGAIRLWK